MRFNVTVLALLLTALCSANASAEPGLLLIAHGAPMEQWNKPVLEFGKKVADEALKSGQFKAVRTAMLEFTQPDVPGAVAELEAAGCDRIVVVPLFIAPSGHTLFDVPTVLGIYSSPSLLAVIAEEGGRIAKPTVPITLTQTLSEGDILSRFAADEVKLLSKNPKDEALVLIAHGDHNHHRISDRLMRQITTYCCGRSGIDYGDWAFVEIGQSYARNGLGAIERALEKKRRVIVVGIYVSSSAASIHRRVTSRDRRPHGDGAAMPGSMPPGARAAAAKGNDVFDGRDVVFSPRGVVTHPRLIKWVLSTATDALGKPDTK